jgi:putative Ca2+/H+ antiporter (TMEM165/GDT1 family)
MVDLLLILQTSGLLFLMELGDKTQLVILSLTAQTRQGLMVFLGGAAAFAALNALGVFVGAVALAFLPADLMARLSAVAFILLGLYMLWKSREVEEEDVPEQAAGGRAARGPLRVFALTAGLIAAAELGDKSQLSVIALTAQTAKPLEVFLGATLGLAAVTLAGALVGRALVRWVPELWITRAAAAFFIVAGVVVLAGTL